MIEEFELLKSQSVISKSVGHGGRRFIPYAFTEQGVAMRSSVLNSERARFIRNTLVNRGDLCRWI
jgi:hypothetical protein